MNRNDVITALTGCVDCAMSLKSPIVHISFQMAATILELLKEQEAEKRKMMQDNWKAQMNMLGYDESGNPLP